MPKTLIVVGGDLYRIAAQQLGDATQWVRIAQASGLTDPVLQGLTRLTIPDPDPSQSGGVPQQ